MHPALFFIIKKGPSQPYFYFHENPLLILTFMLQIVQNSFYFSDYFHYTHIIKCETQNETSDHHRTIPN